MLIKLRLADTKNYGAILRHLILDATLVTTLKTTSFVINASEARQSGIITDRRVYAYLPRRIVYAPHGVLLAMPILELLRRHQL